MPERYLSLGAGVVILTGSIFWQSYSIERYQTLSLLLTFTLAFAAYLWIYYQVQHSKEWVVLIAAALLIRLMLLPMMPNLSDDVYRFVWDGRLLIQGEDPFAYSPDELMQRGYDKDLAGIDQELYQSLNSPGYFTIYPPVHQAVFALSAWLGSSVWQSAVIIRLLLILGECLTFWLLSRLFRQHRISQKTLLLYALNPLVIVELTGNLHFEGLMVTFLLLSYWLMKQQKLLLSASGFGLAVCTKLLPLMLLPLYLRRLGWKKAAVYYLTVGGVVFLLFAPLLSEALLRGLSSSIGLYFQKFEFNASLYYIVREIGYELKGYNTIATSGRQLALAAFAGIIIFSLLERKKHLPAAWMWVWLIYMLSATTVHPWYIVPLFVFSLFSGYRFALLWTALVFFSYAGYEQNGFNENLWLTFIEYLLVLGMLVLELWKGPAAEWGASKL
ncbi:MAG: polyprenol phosphomannose-dependent alpha 1,6 mannosyltransferase MptB [Cyclobacteriaceae bacterium]